MTIRTKEELYRFYSAGDKTTEGQWWDLIDSLFNILDSGDDLNPYTYSNILFVDGGAVETPVKGQIIRPYPTLNAAQADALPGDLVVVFPGTYYTGNIFKDGVTYYAFPGVKIIRDISAVGPVALFADSEGAGTCRLFGDAELETDFFAALITQPETVFQLECKKIRYLYQGISYVPLFFLLQAEKVDLKIGRIEAPYFFNAMISVADLSINIECDEIVADYPGRIGVFTSSDKAGVVWNVNIKKLSITGTNSATNTIYSVNAMPLSPRPVLNIGQSIINTSMLGLVMVQGVDAFINNVRFVCNTEVFYPDTLYVFAHSHLIPGAEGSVFIKDCEVIMENDIATVQTVFDPDAGHDYKIIGTLTSNLPVDDHTLFSVGEYNYDSDFGVN